MNTQLKLTVISLLFVICSCCSTSDLPKQYGPVETAVSDIVLAMQGEFGKGNIRTTFTSDSLMALLKKQGRQNEYEVLLPYKLELSTCKNNYHLKVYDGKKLIFDDVNCTPDYVDSRVYMGEKPLSANYDLCNCVDK